jgi:hypothetical protein
MRPQLTAKNPGLSFPLISKLLSLAWKELPQPQRQK